MSFPELLRQCRKQKHMSQAELASLLGVTQQAVGKWESGKSSPDPTTVAKLAEILDTTADYLLGLFVNFQRPHRGGPDRRALLRQLCVQPDPCHRNGQGGLRRAGL